MWRPTGITFRAIAADGRTFDISENIEVVDAHRARSRAPTAGIRKRFVTRDGYQVNPIDERIFEVVGVQPYLETVRVSRFLVGEARPLPESPGRPLA
jgi:hypothetical protein